MGFDRRFVSILGVPTIITTTTTYSYRSILRVGCIREWWLEALILTYPKCNSVENEYLKNK